MAAHQNLPTPHDIATAEEEPIIKNETELPCSVMNRKETRWRFLPCFDCSCGRLVGGVCLLIAVILVLTAQVEYGETQKNRLGAASYWWTATTEEQEQPQQFSCRMGSGFEVQLPQVPDLIIAGAPKCGTTTLAHWLLDHPKVLPTKKWECHFFTTGIHPREFEPLLEGSSSGSNRHEKKDNLICELRKRYLHQWPALSPTHNKRGDGTSSSTRGKSMMHERHYTFDKTPDYLYPSRVPALIRALFAESEQRPKIVVLLRNPVERAYSHYRMGQRMMREEHVPFEDFISREIKLLREMGLFVAHDEDSDPTTSIVGSKQEQLSLPELDKLFDQVSDQLKGHNYLSRGLYAMQLERWFRHGLGDDLLVLPFPYLETQPEQVYSAILELVGMPTHTLSDELLHKQFNYNNALTDPLHNSTRNMLATFFHQANQDLVELLERHNHSQNYDWQKVLVE
ncbi:Carbohydrate (N-acetylgalactosamine 4-sulfate 6-O) sulfotransferase 15 [Seminavis robusta]|uniref:Carbohydrate (N-acetylgalactosamine 4-sulfate 6-O) sulfotransferase 15 n=1 Tax=Seminavis robusta TaxID=568900 RepID=A0A9N8HPK6_9STRA|nr:Carbohydrate (N-acetylgalactosamine 4-sulfate 6-O) sulfotransferase 15 [Seminavis robusta]|eukprot:Sro1337_g264140.1 Carbohydrate (N-acetylgalactosamine 4-sulfate 6-O) sulfotransferase 15 (454) ;mRNA; f:18103-19464